MDLSVIVPVYNEIKQLPLFLDTLAAQQDVDLEVLIVDGGSDDESRALVADRSEHYPYPLRLVPSEKGRARQLNTGAGMASAATLLFLHVDSIFSDEHALASAVGEFENALTQREDDRISAHFRLKFQRSDNNSGFGYYFWEGKARLDRSECTHGDQGFLMRKRFFADIGPFDDSLPIAEDTYLAEKVRCAGAWLLLTPEIRTSARRFEKEGLEERQTLNALIMCFVSIGWPEFFAEAKSVYATHSATGKLHLDAFFDLVDRLNRETAWPQRLRRWYRVGIYVRPNAWQLAYLRDIKRNFSHSVPVDDIRTPSLDFHDKWFDRVTDNPVGRLIAMIGTWIWYRLTARRFRTAG